MLSYKRLISYTCFYNEPYSFSDERKKKFVLVSKVKRSSIPRDITGILLALQLVHVAPSHQR